MCSSYYILEMCDVVVCVVTFHISQALKNVHYRNFSSANLNIALLSGI